MLQDLDAVIASLGELCDRPAGTIRITIDYGLADVVADRFDAGVRLGGEIARDMIALRIGPDIPMAIVGSPVYFRTHAIPASPAQLIDHRAINLRRPISGTLNGWRLMRGGRQTRTQVEGQLILNTIDLILAAVLDGHGREGSKAACPVWSEKCSRRPLAAAGLVKDQGLAAEVGLAYGLVVTH